MQLGGGQQLVFSTFSFCDYTYSREFEWHIDFSSCKEVQANDEVRSYDVYQKGLTFKYSCIQILLGLIAMLQL